MHALRPRVPRLVHLHRLAQGDDPGDHRGRPRAPAQRARPLRHRLQPVHVLRHLHRGLPVRRAALEPPVRVRRGRHPRPAAREGPARRLDGHRAAAARARREVGRAGRDRRVQQAGPRHRAGRRGWSRCRWRWCRGWHREPGCRARCVRARPARARPRPRPPEAPSPRRRQPRRRRHRNGAAPGEGAPDRHPRVGARRHHPTPPPADEAT